MSVAAGTHWDVRITGSPSNGGGFDPTNPNFATDLTATSGNASSPVVSSASYSFVAGDVGARVFVKSGANWTPGWYPIASVSAGSATLSAAIGSGVLYSSGIKTGTTLSTAAGCATTASPTGGTWGVDYSQQDSPQFTFADLVIDATTSTKFTSAAFPVGKNFVGNVLSVTSGAGFTVQRVGVTSVSGATATCDTSLGTTASTGGGGKLGGSLDHPATCGGVYQSGNWIYVKYSATSYLHGSSANVSGGKFNAANSFLNLVGWDATRTNGNVDANRPIIEANASSTVLWNVGGVIHTIRNFDFYRNSGGGLTTISGLEAGNLSSVSRCRFRNLQIYGMQIDAGVVSECEFNACSQYGLTTGNNPTLVTRCVAIACGYGFNFNNENHISHSIAINSTTAGFSFGSRESVAVHCVAYGVTGGGNGFTGSNVYAQYCLAVNCSGVGFGATARLLNCAGYNNTGGNIDPTSAAYANGFVTLAGDPFTNAAGLDFSLNSTAGAGAACKAVAAAYPGLTPTSAEDIGAYQSAAGAGGGLLVSPGFGGV